MEKRFPAVRCAGESFKTFKEETFVGRLLENEQEKGKSEFAASAGRYKFLAGQLLFKLSSININSI